MTRIWRMAVLAGLIGGSAVPVRAETATARWYAYFYAAPRADARVLDEVDRETKLDLRDCENGWCRVRYGEADGYVREEVVRGPENAVSPDGSSNDETCLAAAQPGGAAWQSERFCRSGP